MHWPIDGAQSVDRGVLCGSLRYRAPKHLPQTEELKLPDHLRCYAAHLPYLQTVYLFRDALETLDARLLSASASRGLPQGGTPYLAGWLTILKRDPQDGAVFLDQILASTGTLREGEMDAVYVVHHLRSYLDHKKPLRPAQRAEQTFYGILNAYDAWTNGREFRADDYRTVTREAVLNQFNPVLRDNLARLSITPIAEPRKRWRSSPVSGTSTSV